MTYLLPLRRAWMPAILTGLMLFTTGCLSAEFKVAINENDTADIAYTLLVDVEQLGELAAAMGSAIPDTADLSGDALVEELFEGEDPCDDLRTTLTTREVISTEVTEGGLSGVRCTATAIPLAELTDFGDDTTLSIVRAGSTTTVEIGLQGVDELAGADGDVMTEAIGSSFAELLQISFVMSAPGALGDNNATSVDGATATWLVTPDSAFVVNGDAQMRAVWTDSGSSGGGSTGIVVALVLLGVAIVAVVAVVVLRRRNSTPTSGDLLPPPPAG